MLFHKIFRNNIFLFPDLSFYPFYIQNTSHILSSSIFNHTLHIPLKIHVRNSWKIIQDKSPLCKIDTRFAPPPFKSHEKNIPPFKKILSVSGVSVRGITARGWINHPKKDKVTKPPLNGHIFPPLFTLILYHRCGR